ncbi:hypothetical protein K3729_07020 [Rhodobacteraceae bacterium S2214]|nr:hypothetical protein K3729_07020 [Rhodobacteraceae bacterium S2214]
MRNLFEDVVDLEQQHPNFIALKQADRRIIVEEILVWAEGFIDRDGNDKFRKEFQTTFNSSFWELYLFAIFKTLGYDVDFEHNAPDFCFKGTDFVVEAVTANAALGDLPEWQKTFEGVAEADVKVQQAISIERLSNSVHSKHEKYLRSYRELSQCSDKAFIIAIGNYSTQDFFQLGDVALQKLLYDDDNEMQLTKRNGASIDLGLFKKDEFKTVSAVIYSSTATTGKARALRDKSGSSIFRATRIKNLTTPIQIHEPSGTYYETLADGLRVFHNPNAETPLSSDSFAGDEDIMQFFFDKEGKAGHQFSPRGDLAMRQVMNFVTYTTKDETQGNS